MHKIPKKKYISFYDLQDFINSEELAVWLDMNDVADIRFVDDKLNKENPKLVIESSDK